MNPDPERSKAAFRALPLTALLGEVLARGQELKLVRRDFSRERLSRTVANTLFLAALWAAYRSERSVEGEPQGA